MDVLKTLREHPYRLTRIMYKANLSHAKGKECIATLMKQDFVNISGFKVVSGMESPVYYITDKGLLHLQKYEEFIRGTKQ
jgi:predicted transcriptional regulator